MGEFEPYSTDSCEREFVNTAKQFINLMDSVKDIDPNTLISRLLWILPKLLSLGIQLPDTSRDITDDISAKSLKDAHYRRMAINIEQLLGSRNYYSNLWDPYNEKSLTENLLSDDLSDVYKDLFDPLVEYESGSVTAKANAIFEWKHGMTTGWHTARHIISALLPLQHLMLHGFG